MAAVAVAVGVGVVVVVELPPQATRTIDAIRMELDLSGKFKRLFMLNLKGLIYYFY
jgi:hypothetical protein